MEHASRDSRAGAAMFIIFIFFKAVDMVFNVGSRRAQLPPPQARFGLWRPKP